MDFLEQGKQLTPESWLYKKNALHLNPDDWCVKLFPKEEWEQNWDLCFAKTLEVLWNKIEETLPLKQDIVFDMGFWSKKSRDEARERAKKLGIEPVLYYIYAPDNILKDRLRFRTGIIAENNLRNFDKIKKSFESPEDNETHILINNF